MRIGRQIARRGPPWLPYAIVPGAGALVLRREPRTPPPLPALLSPGLSFVCGPRNPEDIVALPGRDELITSGLGTAHAAGKLYLIDAARRRHSELAPRVGPPSPEYAQCPGTLDLARFQPHGIALGRSAAVAAELLVVNHGQRESIEFFAVSGAPTALTWLGCVSCPTAPPATAWWRCPTAASRSRSSSTRGRRRLDRAADGVSEDRARAGVAPEIGLHGAERQRGLRRQRRSS